MRKLFCSLISLLRYVKINNINYIFSNEISFPEDNGNMKFRESETKIHFIDKINSRIKGHDFYNYLRINPYIPKVIPANN
jgi:hypothetical protein